MNSRLVFNLTELLNLFSTNHPKLKKILEANEIKPIEKVKNQDFYELKSVLDAWVKDATEKRKGNLDRNAEDARLKSVQADIKEIDLAEKKGELLDKETVEKEVSEILVIVRNKLLILPDILTSLVYGVEDKLKVSSIIKKKINDSLEELARMGTVIETPSKTNGTTTKHNG